MHNLKVGQSVRFDYTNRQHETKKRLVRIDHVDGDYFSGIDYLTEEHGYRNFSQHNVKNLEVLVEPDDVVEFLDSSLVIYYILFGMFITAEELQEVLQEKSPNEQVFVYKDLNFVVFRKNKVKVTTMNGEETVLSFDKGDSSVNLFVNGDGQFSIDLNGDYFGDDMNALIDALVILSGYGKEV